MKSRILAAAVLLGLVVGACGGDDAADDSHPKKPHTSSGEGGSDGAGGADPTGGEVSSTTVGGGGIGPGAGGSGSGGGSPGVLQPLGTGFSWTYGVSIVGGGSVCAGGRHEAKVTGSSTIGGKNAFKLTSWCTGAGPSDVAPGEGDEVFLYYGGEWLPMIGVPVEEGHTWTYFNSTNTWHHEGPITVPAGTFDDCWTAKQNVAYQAYTTYCRGIGVVRSYSKDLNGSGWDAKLSATSGF